MAGNGLEPVHSACADLGEAKDSGGRAGACSAETHCGDVQRQLHRCPPEQHVHSLESQTEETVEVNALHCSEPTFGSAQLEELSRKVQCLSAELAQLQTDSERSQTAHEYSKPSKHSRRIPVCWNCKERGHI